MKRQYLSILYVVLLSLLISGAILVSKPTDKSKYRAASNDAMSTITTYDKEKESADVYKNCISRYEEIMVLNNSDDIDLHANLVEDTSGQVSINLNYKIDEKYVNKKIYASSVSEIRNMFKLREQEGEGYRVNNLVLNQKMNKIYFQVERRKDKKYSHTAIYSYNLKNNKIEKVIYDLGAFTKFSISPDGKYNAISYEVCPQNLAGNEKTILLIIRCSDNKIVLNSNEDLFENKLNKSNFYIYSYDFMKWKNNNIFEMNQKIKAKDNLESVKNNILYYDLNNNTFSKKVY